MTSMSSNTLKTTLATTENLRQLCIIRTIVLLGQLLALAYARFQLRLDIAYAPLLSICLGMIVITALTWWRLGKPAPVVDIETFAHLLLDVTALTFMLFFSGGAANPFVSYYLVPLSISAATLPWRFTWAIALCCIGAYSALLFYHVPLAALQPHGQALGSALPNLHIIGMWGNFVISAGLITYFVVKMANRLRNREAQLRAHREQDLSNEQMLSVATLAAGTAHELGTPLSTLAIALEDMAADMQGDEHQAEQIQLLQRQVQSCRSTLQNLVATAHEHAESDVISVALGDYLQDLLAHWRLLRPDVSVNIHWHATATQLATIKAPAALQQAILNLLNNAADACPDAIQIDLQHDAKHACMQIIDHGPGIPMHVADSLGTPFVSQKEGGLGLGLFLSHATLSRLGGSVCLYNRDAGGTLTEITLPLAAED